MGIDTAGSRSGGKPTTRHAGRLVIACSDPARPDPFEYNGAALKFNGPLD